MMAAVLPSPTTAFQRILENKFNLPPDQFLTMEGETGNVIKLFDPRSGMGERNQVFKVRHDPADSRLIIRSIREDGDEEQSNVGYTGNEILYNLKSAARDAGIKNIHIGQDRANLSVRDEDGREIIFNLAKLKTLQTGHSWYNNHGFYGEDHDEVMNHNAKIRDNLLTKYVKNKGRYNAHADYFETFGHPIEGTTVAEFGELTKELLQKNKAISADRLGMIRQILDKINFKTEDRELTYRDM